MKLNKSEQLVIRAIKEGNYRYLWNKKETKPLKRMLNAIDTLKEKRIIYKDEYSILRIA